VNAVLRGDRESFGELDDRYLNDAYGVSRAYLSNRTDAEDAVPGGTGTQGQVIGEAEAPVEGVEVVMFHYMKRRGLDDEILARAGLAQLCGEP